MLSAGTNPTSLKFSLPLRSGPKITRFWSQEGQGHGESKQEMLLLLTGLVAEARGRAIVAEIDESG
jgi:hypothetical protein